MKPSMVEAILVALLIISVKEQRDLESVDDVYIFQAKTMSFLRLLEVVQRVERIKVVKHVDVHDYYGNQ